MQYFWDILSAICIKENILLFRYWFINLQLRKNQKIKLDFFSTKQKNIKSNDLLYTHNLFIVSVKNVSKLNYFENVFKTYNFL